MVGHGASHPEWASYLRTLQRTHDLIAERQHNATTILNGLADAKRSIQASRSLLQRLAERDGDVAELHTDVAHEFSAIGDLVAQIDRVIQRGNPVNVLIEDIRLLIASETAPEMVMGILPEGIVQMLLQCIPHRERHDVVIGLWLMFYKRLELMDADAL